MTIEDFQALWDTLTPIGRSATTGGYVRFSWSAADRELREWFAKQATARDLAVETDRNGNMWAWWGSPDSEDAVVTGSHVDSVPHGGAYDGPLGIVSAFLAVDVLRARGARPVRPIGVVGFTEEEGARFGVACLGSRLLVGAIAPERASRLRDADGVTLAEAMTAAGADPSGLGPDPERLARIGAFVELHIEQGRALADQNAAVGVASAVWPHGRWRFDFEGEGNHAGTTPMGDRRDPMLTCAYTVLAANEDARRLDVHATIGQVRVEPNATNAIPSRVSGWLDARAPDQGRLSTFVEALENRVRDRARRDGTTVQVTLESVSPLVEFDHRLRDRIVATLGQAPVLPTQAGHDAAVLASHVPTAMLFVRNPTGVSHAPTEHATAADCTAGVRALAAVLEELACR